MHPTRLLLLAALQLLATTVSAIGWATYAEIREGANNAGQIAYSPLDRSDTLFLYIQILEGGDHEQVIADFKTLARNYGARGVAVIPRVRYGKANGDVATEPSDASVILDDVATWAAVFAEVAGTIEIPVVQAGFLGLWGEWHSGPFCPAHGTADSAANLAVKKQIVQALQKSGRKIALRYPQDHEALFLESRAVTLHNDCIFDEGPKGSDGGTFFPEQDRQRWVDYTKRVAAGNTYGGEGCSIAGSPGAYDWSDYADLCGGDGLIPYIDDLQIAYMNPGNPSQFQDLFYDESQSDCVDKIEAALQSHV